MRLYLFFIILISVFLISCRKECQYNNLPDRECSDGYDLVSGTTLEFWHLYPTASQSELVINDDSAYANEFNGDKPLGEIDFSTSTILGRYVWTNWADSWSHQHYLCYNPNEKIWKFKVEYSLSGQCHGSGLYNIEGMFWIICPKIPDTDTVIFEVIDINPFPD
jgi:hypothetical protein